MNKQDFICPCGKNNNLYRDCCKLVHDDIFQAKTAEQLMRSRYSAFVLCNGDYLLHSHSDKYRDSSNIANTMRWARSVAWNRLEIIASTNGLENDSEGTVEFKAYFKEKNKLKCIHENSLFHKENNHWVYMNGL
jgi:SEC-C motif-containing protein